ncbi:unnamed protein product [Mytilus edulis]|uniref:DZANK-type domain-containing protein n=1 Tax=Mytilus edulis TaxID=6550 RepID=A0A8S3SFE9_MYTED|nr:unnamed protein product [Mytilus edulis]
MKCKNNVDGGICGEEIPQSSKFCLACGGQVAKEDDTTTKACPQCSSLITKRQKFCSECGWRIDPSIFLAPKILCAGKDDDGNTCGAELIPGVKFCTECGNDQSKLNEQDKEDTKGTGPKLPASAISAPSGAPVNDLDKNNQQSEAMETDETLLKENAIPKSDNATGDNNMNDQSTQPECPAQGPSLSESGTPVTSDELMEIPVTESGLTKTDTNETENLLRSKEKNKQFAEVHFHCIVSPSLWSNLERDKLYLTFEDSTLGGWQSRKHLMKGERQIASKTSNPCWTYCLPILHFLQGKCAPFQQASAAGTMAADQPFSGSLEAMKTCKVCKNNFDEDFYENHESNCTNLFHQTIKCLCCKKHLIRFTKITLDNMQMNVRKISWTEWNMRREKLEEGDVHSGTAVHCFKCNEIVLKKDIKDHYYRVRRRGTRDVRKDDFWRRGTGTTNTTSEGNGQWYQI